MAALVPRRSLMLTIIMGSLETGGLGFLGLSAFEGFVGGVGSVGGLAEVEVLSRGWSFEGLSLLVSFLNLVSTDLSASRTGDRSRSR